MSHNLFFFSSNKFDAILDILFAYFQHVPNLEEIEKQFMTEEQSAGEATHERDRESIGDGHWFVTSSSVIENTIFGQLRHGAASCKKR